MGRVRETDKQVQAAEVGAGNTRELLGAYQGAGWELLEISWSGGAGGFSGA